MALATLPAFLLEPIVRAALLEDLGRAGDITTDTIVPAEARMRATIGARHAGTIAGIEAALLAFRMLDPAIGCEVLRHDGERVAAGDVVMCVKGPARPILSAERVALNFLCRLSGIASAVAALVQAVEPHRARITCTRKTTPGLRALEKSAVRAGGGANHRFGLDDAVLIKDNHIAVAGGIAPAIARARAAIGHLVKIEVEVDTLEQLEEAMALAPDAVLLDNMSVERLREAVAMVGGRAITEASGRIDPTTAPLVASTGVDLISVGWVTHSAPILDMGLDAAG